MTLYDTLKQCVEWLERHGRQAHRIGEQNTKASLIEPVISALEWDILDPDEVHREYRRRTTDNPVDYALLIMRTPRLFIEAKGLGENLDDPRWANQTISYAAVAGVEWVALTDGAEWRIYNAHAPVPVEQKLFRSVRLVEDVDEAVDVLALLSKNDMRDNRIQDLWKGYFVDRQVRGALADLFGGQEPPRELVSLIVKQVPNLSRAEVRASLMRARATFDFPATAPLVTSNSPLNAGQAVRSGRSGPSDLTGSRSPKAPSARTKVSAAERALTVADLIDAGLLSTRRPLTAEWRREQRQAELLSDGSLRFNGQNYKSLSSAGEAVKMDIAGLDLKESTRATDGWEFWTAPDPTSGEPERLKELRRRLADQS
ncbi:hypothetical protein [Kutzneria sp. 744]|uniref:restriction system modified-DNA reader domain-containing protein n=1 Tax=Kutzneria sp. (strain 744) TaxID=345341 RepID=UPI0004B5E9E5|nr:hypothetical protein [Kutzneria sp. 744]